MVKINIKRSSNSMKFIGVIESIKMLLRNTRFVVGLSIFISLLVFSCIGPILYPRDPLSTANPPLKSPSSEYPLGTDAAGRDLLATLMYSTRVSLYVGFLSAAIATILGVIAAMFSVAFGGIVDNIVTAIISFLLSIPTTLLALVIAFYMPVKSYEVIAIILGSTMWAGFARALRARLLSLKEEDFIILSKISGYSSLRIIFEDMIPSVASYIMVFFATHIDDGIVGEATFSLLGLRPSEGYSLGLMIRDANASGAILRGIWWWFVPPGIILILLILSMTLISTAIDEIFNPRLRKG
jgi:peptide/nickel transport system permease protein